MTKTTGTSKFTINANQFDFVMGMLNQYSKPWSAVIREYVSNAVDAVRTVENPNVQVILPEYDSNDTQLIIKDNGIGMSLEFIENNLNSYANSSKRNDDASIGAKGIGSKSAFSLTDKFTITSVHDGEKTVAIHDRKVGHITYESEKPVNEPNGTIVTIPIHDAKIANDMINGVNSVINGFNSSIVHVYNNDGSVHSIDWFDSKIDKVKLSDNMYLTTWDGLHVIQAGVIYEVGIDLTYDALLMLRGDTSKYNYSYDTNNTVTVLKDCVFSDVYNRLPDGLVITLPANVLELTPSRENIITNNTNAAVIAAVLRNYAEHILSEASQNGYNIMRASEVNKYVVNYVKNEINDSRIASLTWNEAYRFMRRLDDAISSNGSCTDDDYRYGAFSMLGGHRFTRYYEFNALIPNANNDGTDMITSLYAKRKLGAEKSSYDHKAPNENNMLRNYISHVQNYGIILLIKNIPSDEYGTTLEEGILRKRNTYINEIKWNPSKIDYIMLSTGNPLEHLNYWDSKDKNYVDSKFMQVDYADYKKTMIAHANRMKAIRKQDKANDVGTVASNITIIGYSNGKAYKKTSRLSQVIEYASAYGCYLIRMDNDDFYRAYDNKNYMKSLYEKISIAQNKSFRTGRFIIIRNKGSKALMQTITENTITVDEIDYMSNANIMMRDYQKRLYSIDIRRIKIKMLSKYRISQYDDLRNIFNVIHYNDYGIISDKTKDVFEILSDVNKGETDKSYNADVSDSETLSNAIMKLMKYGCVMDEEWRINGCSDEVKNALAYYENNYPLLKYVLGKKDYSSNLDNIDDKECRDKIIDYINQCDELRESRNK